MPATVVLDAWVSAFLNPHGFPAKLLDAWISGAFQVVTSALLIEEVAQTLSTPRLMVAAHLAARGITTTTVARFLQHLAESAPELT